ncbi:MAG: hypothetical protein ACYS0J_20625 [Planctomycetota bacterium]
MHRAVDQGGPDSKDTARRCDCDIAQLLLDGGADVNGKEEGLSPRCRRRVRRGGGAERFRSRRQYRPWCLAGGERPIRP